MPEVIIEQCELQFLNFSCLARLQEIKSSIFNYNTTLYRACANANPHNMNEAMIGISKEVIFDNCDNNTYLFQCRFSNYLS